jgi:hypothetical protein
VLEIVPLRRVSKGDLSGAASIVGGLRVSDSRAPDCSEMPLTLPSHLRTVSMVPLRFLPGRETCCVSCFDSGIVASTNVFSGTELGGSWPSRSIPSKCLSKAFTTSVLAGVKRPAQKSNAFCTSTSESRGPRSAFPCMTVHEGMRRRGFLGHTTHTRPQE